MAQSEKTKAAKPKFYSILVGEDIAPAKIEIGFLNKKTGQPQGEISKGVQKVGQVPIPNSSNIWGKLKKDKEGKLTGEIEPLDWGTGGGGVIQIRYLRGCNSLSVMYQRTVARMEPGQDEFELILQQGVNDFIPEEEPMKIEMLKLHTFNGDNKSRNPTLEIVYEEVKEKTRSTNLEQEMETTGKAFAIALECSRDAEKLEVVATILDMDLQRQNESLANELQERVKEDPKHFLSIIQHTKDDLLNLLNKDKQYSMLDFNTSKGHVYLIDEKEEKSELFSGIPKDAKNPIEYIVDNLLEPAVFDGYRALQTAVKDYELVELV